MILSRIISVVIALVLLSNSYAQSSHLKFKPFYPYTWMVGGGWSFVDNDGLSHSRMFDVKNSWQAVPYPSYIFVDKYLDNGMSLEFSFSFNDITEFKMFNEAYVNGFMLSPDLTFKYSFYKFFRPVTFFDPYIGIGAGFTFIETTDVFRYPTANGVVGLNFWIGNFGIRLQGTAKLALVNDIYYNDKNYINYHAGIVYRFPKPEHARSTFHKSRFKWAKRSQSKMVGRRN